MYGINVQGDNPYENLALEEYLLTHLPQNTSCLLLWQNRPSVILGRFQYAYDEINLAYVKQHQIDVVRRISGGGAVYHDGGNLNYSFICPRLTEQKFDFVRFTAPVIQVLQKLGLQAECTGRNDLFVGDYKISGNAQYFCGDKILHHGTLLFDADLTMLKKVLSRKHKCVGAATSSMPSRVMNIRSLLAKDMSIRAFKQLLFQELMGTGEIYELSAKEKEGIAKLQAEKYENNRWNYGDQRAYTYQRAKRFAGGTLEVRLVIVQEMIQLCQFYGDFFCNEDVEKLAESFVGKRYQWDCLAKQLAMFNIDKFFQGLTQFDILALCFKGK